MKLIKYFGINKYTITEQKILLLMLSSILLGVLVHFYAIIPARISTLIIIFSVLTGFGGIFLYVGKYRSNRYTKIILFLLSYFLIVGMSYGRFNPNFRGGDFGYFVTQDLRFIMYIAIGSIMLKYFAVYHKIIIWLGAISILFSVLGLITFDFGNISSRSNTWSFSYYCWWLTSSVFLYIGYYYKITKRNKFIAIGTVLGYLILGLLFLKRAAIINVFFLYFFSSFLSNEFSWKYAARRFVPFLIIISVLIFIFLIFGIAKVGGLVNANVDRILATEWNINNDRFIESASYFESVTTKQLIFGNGIGYYPSVRLRVNSYESRAIQVDKKNALHIGFYNIIFKGGLILMLFYAILFIKVIAKLFRKSTLTDIEKVCLGVAGSTFISLAYAGSWTLALSPLTTYPPIFYLLLNRKKVANV